MTSDLIFTNDLGTLRLKRFLLSYSRSFQWDGRSVRQSLSVSANGYIARDLTDPELIDGLLTDARVVARYRGSAGTLTLPWKTIEGIRFVSLSQPDGNWIDHHPVSIQFEHESPELTVNDFALNFRGLSLHNPTLHVTQNDSGISDEISPLWLVWGTVLTASQVGPGVVRRLVPPGMMGITVEGTLILDDGLLPDILLDALAPRVGMTPNTFRLDLPAGYPVPFHMSEACPELALQLPIAHALIVDATVDWDVSQASADVRVDMVAQPQHVIGVAS